MKISLFIDTHSTKNFAVATTHTDPVFGKDASTELIQYISELEKVEKFEEIVILRGPGSLTGLRIGSAIAQGLALGRKASVKGITIWDLLLEEFPESCVLFNTGTKKWIKKTASSEQIIDHNNLENEEFKEEILTNAQDKVPFLKTKEFPIMISLMKKHYSKANREIDILYPITNFP
jgi:tRNA A37 threonylcarbamoyladenosine modification protein TsaB